MSEGIPFGDLIVIGAVAIFIILRYRSVLGQKSGHDFSKPKPTTSQERVVDMSDYRDGPMEEEEIPLIDLALGDIKDPALMSAIAKMKELDPYFTIDGFLSGAKSAFEMVIEAYSNHDREALRMLLSREVYGEFEAGLVDQEKKKQRFHTTLVSLLSGELVSAEIRKSTAVITVQFVSEQIHTMRDLDGKVIGGDASDIQKIDDEWVFERDLKSRNPNWTITAT